MKTTSCHRAFTLIELLIVVAIIGILAAIAVPNFLEAQARAKVARARADMKTVASAMELYIVDHNEYPYCDPEKDHSYLSDITVLTTPVSYLSSLPQDPFVPRGRRRGEEKYYRYYPISYWKRVIPALVVLEMFNWKWSLMSNGPDTDIDIDFDSTLDAIRGELYMFYDPTNGTVSNGDIMSANVQFPWLK